MKKVLIASENTEITNAISQVLKKYASYFDFTVCTNTDEVIRYIDYELPEIKVIDFTSANIDFDVILNTISEDPWLHNGGVVAIAKNLSQVKIIEEQKNRNILIVQTVSQFLLHFARILRILWQNQQFLFSRGMQELLGASESAEFVSQNDPLDINVYTSFLVNYLYSSNRIDADGSHKLQTTLMELLLNALEHGNCGINYDEKTRWLESGKNILDLIAEKNKNPAIAKKKIYISYIIYPSSVVFKVRDDGDGFNWRSRVQQDIEAGTHGMGIKISENLVDDLTYNEKGNEASFRLALIQNFANTVPRIMSPYHAITYDDKEVVCKQNEQSNDLFFIVSGRYAVYSARSLVSVLTPNDMFIGEMSFLLNDRRSATVLSVGKGQLIKIPKTAFLGLIRKNPHYGIFLSKLLAQRLLIQTKKTAMVLSKNVI